MLRRSISEFEVFQILGSAEEQGLYALQREIYKQDNFVYGFWECKSISTGFITRDAQNHHDS